MGSGVCVGINVYVGARVSIAVATGVCVGMGVYVGVSTVATANLVGYERGSDVDFEGNTTVVR